MVRGIINMILIKCGRMVFSQNPTVVKRKLSHIILAKGGITACQKSTLPRLSLWALFIALICLIIIIVLLGKIMTAVTGNKASQTTPAQAPAPAPAAPAAVPAPAAQPGNQQLVAAIAAAIAEDMGEDVDHIKILSIRRV